ncbi:MAG: HAD-IA family hydrolase [Candidatus Latescibacteria bacterium]|nr:HAD-IA family hydrolase [bacterium]MBD3424885.1 HAD-IA family hydrolase [Candidatus Latescibacterota bacterium]
MSRHNLDLDPDYIRSLKDPIYSRYCRSGEIEVFPEAVRLIRLLEGKGYTLAVASGSYSSDILAILNDRSLEHYFRAVIGKDMVKERKPDPETYLKAATLLKVEPSECVVIEDAVKGIISAHQAGMKAIGVRTDVTEGLDLSGADLVADSLSELRELFASI